MLGFRFVAQNFLIVGLSGLAQAPLLQAQSIDVSAEDLPADFSGYRILDKDKSPFLLTGVPRRDMDSGDLSFMAISPVDPVAARPEAAANKFFGQQKNRPMTWAEASNACNSYNNRGKSWRLPNLTEFKQINRFVGFSEVLSSNSDEVRIINTNWKSAIFLPQFHLFWSDDSSSPEEGLKYAAAFGTDAKYQKMSEVALLSVVCVTYLQGPMREADRIAIEAPVDEGVWRASTKKF